MTTWRAATPDDAVALRNLEKAANLASLGHVFRPAEHPYPDQGVLDRWCTTLVESGVVVSLAADEDGPAAFVAADESVIRHLAVAPRAWGRGVGRAAVVRGLSTMTGPPRLWCLEENHRARGFYERLGWRATGARQSAEWPPHPVEMEYALAGSDHG